jgi:hypothetical protein
VNRWRIPGAVALAATLAVGITVCAPSTLQAGYPRTVIAEEFGADW